MATVTVDDSAMGNKVGLAGWIIIETVECGKPNVWPSLYPSLEVALRVLRKLTGTYTITAVVGRKPAAPKSNNPDAAKVLKQRDRLAKALTILQPLITKGDAAFKDEKGAASATGWGLIDEYKAAMAEIKRWQSPTPTPEEKK